MGSVNVPGASEIKGLIKRQECYFKPIKMSRGFHEEGRASNTSMAHSGSIVIPAKNASIM